MKAPEFKTLLIALDYDPSAEKVAVMGYALAKAMGAKVVILHVLIDLPLYETVYPLMEPWIAGIDADSGDAGKETTGNFLEKVKRTFHDDSIRIMKEEGPFAETIIKVAGEIDADAVVMGSHSKRRFESFLMGSVTSEVIQKTTVPVLIIPNKAKYE